MVYKFYDYNEDDRIIKYDDKTIYLTDRENDLFKILFNSDDIVTYKYIDEVLNLGYSFSDPLTNIRTIISRLKKTLGPDFEITNISGRGYVLKPNYKKVAYDKE